MSHAHDHDPTVPKAAIMMAGALVLFSMALAASVSLGFAEKDAVPTVERERANVAAVQSRNLAFADDESGAVLISDSDAGEQIAVIDQDSKSGGFIRGVLRGLARERRMHGIGAEPPFELTLWEDGSLSLTDSATGRVIELGAFGNDNRAAFRALLPGDAA